MPETYVTPEQVDAMLRTVNNQRDFLLIDLLFRLGCRISELLPLTVSQIDFKNDFVTLQLLKQRLRLACPHCDSRLSRSSKFCQACGRAVQDAVQKALEVKTMRRLPLDRETMGWLKKFIDAGGPGKDGRLFPIAYRTAYYHVTKAARKARLPWLVDPRTGRLRNISPHRLRDAFATMALQSDDSVDSVRMLQERLGHKDYTTTLKYFKVSGKEQKDWYNKLFKKQKPEKEEGDGQA